MTNAGALVADESPVRYSRLFCTRWGGLTKAGGVIDALDSAEYSGSIILLLEEGLNFVKRNTKLMWKKLPDSRLEMPDYVERSVLEALVNALVHRDYMITGSEVHIDMFDDRMEIYSPGGMPDGTNIQDRKLEEVSSVRRNPLLADIFGRLGYMERQGSGLEKILDYCKNSANYKNSFEPKFISDRTQFRVVFPNMNYSESREQVSKQEEPKYNPSTTQVTTQVEKMLSVMHGEMTREEIQNALGLSASKNFRKLYLIPALESGVIEMTQPDSPNSPTQKYRLTDKGIKIVTNA